jgi:hypothetical protein
MLDAAGVAPQNAKTMSERRTYEGGCHCGRVRYEVTTDLERVMQCNCSICSKRGHLLTFVPAEQFRLRSGEESLSDYRFNHEVIHHLFCAHCGVGSFSHGTPPGAKSMVAINVRCLDGVDPGSLSPLPFDGKSL